MTKLIQGSKQYGVTYYEPSPSVVEYLNRELQNLELTDPASLAGKRRKFRRKKETQGTIAKDKKDTFNRIFQGFVDLVYFLEFIEDHQELHEIYEKPLKDLFGINIDELDKDGKRIRKKHRSLFIRFLNASTFRTNLRSKSAKPFDFRISLAQAMYDTSIDVMQTSLLRNKSSRELSLFLSSAQNLNLWTELLARRYNHKQVASHHIITF